MSPRAAHFTATEGIVMTYIKASPRGTEKYHGTNYIGNVIFWVLPLVFPYVGTREAIVLTAELATRCAGIYL